MIKNLLKLSLIMGSTALVGCGSEEGNDNYGFVTPASKPVEMDTANKSVTINVDQLNGEELVLINLLDGVTIEGQQLTSDTTEVFIKGLADPNFNAATVPTLVLTPKLNQVLFFEYDIVNEESAAAGGTTEDLTNILIEPVYIEGNTLTINRHQFSKAQIGLKDPKKEGVKAAEPMLPISQVTYALSYTIDNGYPCVSLDTTYNLRQCAEFLMDEGSNELCHSSGDSADACGQYLIDNGSEHTVECADIENCTSAEIKTVLRNAVTSKIQDADGNLPNVRTLTIVVNNNVN